MSRGRWDGEGAWIAYSRGPKKPPPDHGIKMNKAGTTWWGQRWIEALEKVLSGDAGRLSRGRTYARAGRTHDLVVKGGTVTAKVTGSRTEPYDVEIRLSELSDKTWSVAIAGMAEKAQFAAELLAGRMPKDIDEVFRAAKSSLFPTKRDELVTDCSCPDWGDPCKHVAATHYILGEALDRDPFLLFELRGRTKVQVLEALRRARGSSPSLRSDARAAATDAARVADVPSVALGERDRALYDKPRATLPSIHFSFEAPSAHGALLRQLGSPTAWAKGGSPADGLASLVSAAAETARRIALGETPSEASVLAEPATAALARSRATRSKARARPKRRKRG